ncbi:hypothetical protein SK355_00305 [Candidatus Fukatsuia symbiotica]|uniref:Uncharacterized protein n=1 Tax=Candidatus Fukatsuia symbiotica TaxID=1878942 RepID=A0A2U8I7E5_9GAMM|nr:hypothetical protein [Candidatus Fukatsuia symbiotica]AWK15009.1 hypothetical protein CCS41_11895 [Candidatus Fukatsuia symbiotica]MEA9443805.1 hypothetical protein [Candidatus Fukatsuia symbiotica]
MAFYRKPFNPLPFDDYQEFEKTERESVIKALRDAAYFNTDQNFSITYLQRKELIHRLKITGKPIPNAIISRRHQASTSNTGRLSTACKIAIVTLYEKTHCTLSANYTQAANILSAYVTEAGYNHKFNKDTIKNWYEEVKNNIQKISHR